MRQHFLKATISKIHPWKHCLCLYISCECYSHPLQAHPVLMPARKATWNMCCHRKTGAQMPGCPSAAPDGCQAIWLTPVLGRAPLAARPLAPSANASCYQRSPQPEPDVALPRKCQHGVGQKWCRETEEHTMWVSTPGFQHAMQGLLVILTGTFWTYIHSYTYMTELVHVLPKSPAPGLCSQLSPGAAISGAFSCQSANSSTPVLLELHLHCIYPSLCWYFATSSWP